MASADATLGWEAVDRGADRADGAMRLRQWPRLVEAQASAHRPAFSARASCGVRLMWATAPPRMPLVAEADAPEPAEAKRPLSLPFPWPLLDLRSANPCSPAVGLSDPSLPQLLPARPAGALFGGGRTDSHFRTAQVHIGLRLTDRCAAQVSRKSDRVTGKWRMAWRRAGRVRIGVASGPQIG